MLTARRTLLPVKTLRHLGNCQACMVDHKIRSDRVVHHGYQRPGTGEIVGDCMGVDEPPYELSCEWTRGRLAQLEERLAEARAHLAALPEATTLIVVPSFVAWGTAPEILVLRLGVTEPSLWDRSLENKIRSTEYEIDNIEMEIKLRTKRIADWTLRPLREVNEESIQAEQRAARAKREAERAAVRAEKKAKANALAEKRAAREAEKQKVIDSFAGQLKVLTEQPKSDKRAGAVSALIFEYQKKKHQRFGRWGLYDIDAGEVLVRLGRATQDGTLANGKPYYRYDFSIP